MNDFDPAKDEYDNLTPSWIRKAYSFWSEGDYKSCYDTLFKNSIIRLNLFKDDSNVLKIDVDRPQEKRNRRGENKEDHTPFELSFNSKRERGYALAHNILISHFFSSGYNLDIKFIDHDPKNDKSSMNDSTHPLHQFQYYLENLGKFSKTSLYNLALSHYLTGYYNLSAKVCEEILNPYLNQTDEIYDIKLPLNTSFLYLHAQLMCMDLNNNKIQDVLNFLEKNVTNKIEYYTKQLEEKNDNEKERVKLINEVNKFYEYDVWIRIFKTQISLAQTKMKLSKREVSSMMSSLYKWESFRNENIQIIDPNVNVISSSESQEYDQNNEKKVKYPNTTHVAAQVVKSRLLNLRNNQEKAEKELNEQYIKELSPSLYYNNLGVIEFHRKNYLQAAINFFTAYEENFKLKSLSKEGSLFPYPYLDIKYGVIYNIGVQMLLLGQSTAKACFKYLSKKQRFSNNPIIWLRLAESDIQMYLSKITPKQPQYSVDQIYREGGKIQINTKHPYSPEADQLLNQISKYVITALLLLERYGKLPNHSYSIPNIANEKQAFLKEYVQKVYCYIILSWISLEQKDFIKAREYAINVRNLQKDKSDFTGSTQAIEYQLNHYFFLAQLYLGEAELRIGNVQESLKILSEQPAISDINSINPKAILYCNLATVYIMKGDFAQAQQLLSQSLALSPSLSSAKILQVYFELRQGNSEMAVRLLRDYRINELWITTRK